MNLSSIHYSSQSLPFRGLCAYFLYTTFFPSLPCLTFSFTYLLLPTESPRRETPAVKRNSFNTSSFRNGCSSFYANEYNTTCFTGYAIEFLFSAESPLGLCGFPTPPRLHSQTTTLGLSTVCRPVHACAPRQRENSK